MFNMHYAGIGNLYPTLEDPMDRINSKFHAKLIQYRFDYLLFTFVFVKDRSGKTAHVEAFIIRCQWI